MQCPQCRSSLVELSTTQLPQIDVCASAHGVWLDAGEAMLFIEDEAAFRTAVETGTSERRDAALPCPRCSAQLEVRRVLDVTLMTCPSCHGRWFPHGTLTRLHTHYQTGGVSIDLDESAFYRRAGARADRAKQFARLDTSSSPVFDLLYWLLLLGIAFLTVSIVMAESIRQVLLKGRLIHAPDEAFAFLLLGTLAGITFFVIGFRFRRRSRLIESTPTSTVRSLAVGLVEVTGLAQACGPLLTSPFGGMPCVFYFYKVQEQTGTEKNTPGGSPLPEANPISRSS